MRFIGNIFISAICILVAMFILLNSWQFSDNGYWLTALICLICSLIFFSVPFVGSKGGIAVLLIGIYAVLRATGAVDVQFLRYALGIPLFAFGCYMLWLAVGSLQNSNQPSDT